MEDATIDNTMATYNFEHKDVNPKLEKKIGSQMEDSVPATDINIKNHEKETFEKTADDVKVNGGHIVPRIQEPSSEKMGTAELVKKLADNVKATCNHIVPRIQEHTRVNKRAETRYDKHVHTSGNWDPGGGPVKPQD